MLKNRILFLRWEFFFQILLFNFFISRRRALQRGEESQPKEFLVGVTFSSFLVRATSESSSLDHHVFKSFQFSKIKLSFFNLATLGQKTRKD